MKTMIGRRRHLRAISLMALLLFLHASRTMTEDALMEEEEMETNESTAEEGKQESKRTKAKNNKEDEEAFRELESPEDEEPLPDSPILITDNNWRQLDKGEWLIEFYAPWCPACRVLQPRWDQLARDVKAFKEMRVRIAKCDVTTNPWLTGRMMIASLPTIFHIKEKEYRKYSGSRGAEDLYDYLLKKKWQDTPVLEKWREPHGAAMTAMSGFYKLANVVQSIHDTMTISYGFPVWASYVIFGLVTLACGLTAGLFIVCCMDCLSTPSTPERRAAIVEKNRKAREARENQAKLEEKMETEKLEKERVRKEERIAEFHAMSDEAVKRAKSALRSRQRSKKRKEARLKARLIKRGIDPNDAEDNEEAQMLRSRWSYKILNEHLGDSSDEEKIAYSSDDPVSTETTETDTEDTDEWEDEKDEGGDDEDEDEDEDEEEDEEEEEEEEEEDDDEPKKDK